VCVFVPPTHMYAVNYGQRQPQLIDDWAGLEWLERS